MSSKGYRHEYELQSEEPAEIVKVGDAYESTGWREVEHLPLNGRPTHIIFEWMQDGPPRYPDVGWPEKRR